jgi:hypothetical protein
MDKDVVDDDPVGGPHGIPTPRIPSKPGASKKVCKNDGRAIDHDDSYDGTWRIVPARIRIVDVRSPDPNWIVYRHIE